MTFRKVLLASALLALTGCGDEPAPSGHTHSHDHDHTHGDASLDVLDASVEPPDGSVLGAFVWDLPTSWPRPPVPSDNPMSAEKVELGRHLFYDTRLSKNETFSCATCHQQER